MVAAMIVYNGFLHKDAPPQCVTRFFNAAKIRGIDLFPVKNTELTEILLILSEINGENSKQPSLSDKNSKRRGAIKALLSSCSFVIFWDKDVFLCRILENAGLRVFNSSEAVRICDDKALTALRLSEKTQNSVDISEKIKNALDASPLNQNIKMPKTLVAPMTFQNIGYTDLSFLDDAVESLGFPMVVKERNGSLGEQVYSAKNYSELKNLVEKNGSNLLFQEFIDTSRSPRFFDCPAAFEGENASDHSSFDVRVYVVNGKTLGAILRKNPNDFRANIAKGSTAFPYNPTDEEKKIAEIAVARTNLFFGGVDIIADKNGERYLLEVNSNAGFVGFERATGIDVAQKIIDEIIKSNEK
jgi:glutathione synthase/RimK-type ligase-like ATP-grasp enzyme